MKRVVERNVADKSEEIRSRLVDLRNRMAAGDNLDLLVWVIPGALCCAHRPLRYHSIFGGSGRDLPKEAMPYVLKWVDQITKTGIRSIIALISLKELRHYAQLDLGAKDLIDLYRRFFEVRHIPWADPAHQPPSSRSSFDVELMNIREKALVAFDELPKPVLLHCSAGRDRSSPVAAYIWAKHGGL